jgi:hypothetical protein
MPALGLTLCVVRMHVQVIESLFDRGRAADNGKHKFDIAEHGFFRQAVIEHPKDAHALLNWALVLQYLHGDYKEAEQCVPGSSRFLSHGLTSTTTFSLLPWCPACVHR